MSTGLISVVNVVPSVRWLMRKSSGMRRGFGSASAANYDLHVALAGWRSEGTTVKNHGVQLTT
jgi:hypothetical protein